jgi:hypothetical protein
MYEYKTGILEVNYYKILIFEMQMFRLSNNKLVNSLLKNKIEIEKYFLKIITSSN